MRGSVGRVDAQVIAAVARRGVTVTPYQLERWRACGLIPRNARSGLGRGRGSTAVMSPDLLACVEFVGRGSFYRSPSLGKLVPRVYTFLERDQPVPERLVRWALRRAIAAGQRPTVTIDRAYEIAEELAATDRYVHAHLPWPGRTPRGRPTVAVIDRNRAAYQHILAAEHVGVAAVGHAMIEESVAALGWSTPHDAPALVTYLDHILGQSERNLALADAASFDQLAMTGKQAAIAWRDLGVRSGRGRPAWLSAVELAYVRPWHLHCAALIDETILIDWL